MPTAARRFLENGNIARFSRRLVDRRFRSLRARSLDRQFRRARQSDVCRPHRRRAALISNHRQFANELAGTKRAASSAARRKFEAGGSLRGVRRFAGAMVHAAIEGWFIPGVSPIKTCDIHREVLVDVASGLRVPVDDGTRELRRDVYEFWPSELLTLFERAGLPRKSPPPFLPGTAADLLARNGQAPRIIAPASGREIVFASSATMPLQGQDGRRCPRNLLVRGQDVHRKVRRERCAFLEIIARPIRIDRARRSRPLRLLPGDGAIIYLSNSLTSDFSSFNSATDLSILSRLKSLIGTFCTISHLPPRTRTGNDEIKSFSTS